MNSFFGRRRVFWLVFVAREGNTRREEEAYSISFSPLLYACARPRNLALCTEKNQVCFRLVQLLKNNSFFSKFELPTVESLLNGHLGTDGEMAVEKRFK